MRGARSRRQRASSPSGLQAGVVWKPSTHLKVPPCPCPLEELNHRLLHPLNPLRCGHAPRAARRLHSRAAPSLSRPRLPPRRVAVGARVRQRPRVQRVEGDILAARLGAPRAAAVLAWCAGPARTRRRERSSAEQHSGEVRAAHMVQRGREMMGTKWNRGTKRIRRRYRGRWALRLRGRGDINSWEAPTITNDKYTRLLGTLAWCYTALARRCGEGGRGSARARHERS